MLQISTNVSIPDNEIEYSVIRTQDADGQNINKVSSVIHLRFNINASFLTDFYKTRLLNLKTNELVSRVLLSSKRNAIGRKKKPHRSVRKIAAFN